MNPHDVEWEHAVNVDQSQRDNEEGTEDAEEGGGQTGDSHSQDTGQYLAPLCFEVAVIYLKGNKYSHHE